MSTDHPIDDRLPALARDLPRKDLAMLPTPVRDVSFHYLGQQFDVAIKSDDATSGIYGGNKVRKLEYLFAAAIDGKKSSVATFGTVGSNHALATAIHAKELGLACTCFLSHQRASATTANVLRAHLALGTHIVRYGGSETSRQETVAKNVDVGDTEIIPAGGSSWLGTLGFINAGLELAMQIESGEVRKPDRVYVATGTMGTAAGLAIGFAMAGLDSSIEAVRVSMTAICNERAMQALISDTLSALRQYQPELDADLAQRIRVRIRDEFFAGGYAHTDESTDNAVAVARGEMDLQLETTYTGKAMAAVLADLSRSASGRVLFWNTYNAAPLPGAGVSDLCLENLPEQFQRYLKG